MTVSDRDRPLAMMCDRCGREWARPDVDADRVRVDAETHGWTCWPGDDACPACNGVWAAEDARADGHRDAAGFDDTHQRWVCEDAERRARDE